MNDSKKVAVEKLYLRLGEYTEKSLSDAKKGDLCSCGHEANDHDEGDDDVCLWNDCRLQSVF